MLFYVEQGVEFTNEYGDINEQFYISMEDMYERALKLMEKKGYIRIFQLVNSLSSRTVTIIIAKFILHENILEFEQGY